ncbi:hypothetical protein [Denitratisoma oestradiolicum]|uniref:Uncharacterized protein n=1 Tax=Denitratisoma oestradiolicum TaxID=311182 RepID=A0A6S6Y438_9PROT|nr:hypothetical protein [Denitratisoma oestradiolicum]CAB1367378.1 conserved exported protein of unknown function [Denitratisoma oestradiolicum]
MSVFLKNKPSLLGAMLLFLCVGVALSSAKAEIVLQYGVPGYSFGYNRDGRIMSTIVVAPPVAGSNAAYLAQRSRAWYSYGRQGTGSGLPLVIAPMSGMSGDVSERQIRARSHVSQANAYRLHFYDR